MSTDDHSYRVPNDRHYDGAHHMWAQHDPETDRVLVGIDELGLEALGDLAYVSFREVGATVKRGESLGTLEAAKMTDEIICPVSGLVVERNDAATSNPGIVNDDPYQAGWLMAIEPSGWARESAELISGESITPWLESEIERFKSQGMID